MDIFRIEYKNDPKSGPWQLPRDVKPTFQELLFGRSDRIPAVKADAVAEREGVKQPSAHPGPAKDGIPEVADSRKWYFGFSSIAQYHEWFQTPAVREAVLDDGKLVLAKYSVPEKATHKGGHQVIFRYDKVTGKEICTSQFAIGK